MRSVRFSRFGEPIEVLSLEDIPAPEPREGEALVRLRARPINPSDLLTVRGLYGHRPTLPGTPGYEGMGAIERLGPGCSGVSVGQRVIPLGVSGTWQEYILVPAAQLIPVPDSVCDASAAQFVVNPLTAQVMLLDELDVRRGEWLLQTAAGSTLGRIVLQFAAVAGFKTINAIRRPEQAKELKALGADEVICTADVDLVRRVMEITDRKGVRAAIDAVGGETGSQAARCLANHGTLISYGALSMEPFTVHPGLLITKSATVRGFWLSDWLHTAPLDSRQAAIAALMASMVEGRIVPPVEAEYDLADVIQAVQHSETSGRHGKVLLIG